MQRDRTRGHRQNNESPPVAENRRWSDEQYSRAPSSDESQKSFAGVSHSSKGSGATIGYLYPGIRAIGLMSVTSPHLMVKGATAASSDPQGPGHASSHPTPRRGLRLLRPQGAGSDSSGPTGSAPPRPTPEGRIPSHPAPRTRFPPRPFPGGRICYRTKVVALGWDPNHFNHYGMEVHAREHVSNVS